MACCILEENPQNNLIGAHPPILENTRTRDYSGDHSDLRIALVGNKRGRFFQLFNFVISKPALADWKKKKKISIPKAKVGRPDPVD